MLNLSKETFEAAADSAGLEALQEALNWSAALLVVVELYLGRRKTQFSAELTHQEEFTSRSNWLYQVTAAQCLITSCQLCSSHEKAEGFQLVTVFAWCKLE